MSPTAETVIERLEAVRQKWWLFSLLSTTVLAGCGSLTLFLAFAAIDAVARLSQPWLLALFSLWALASAWMAFHVGWRMLRGLRSMEAAARRVELDCPEVGSHLINVVQLAEHVNFEAPFHAAAVHQAAAQIAPLPFEKASARQSRWGRLAICLQTPRDLAESLVLLAILFAVAGFCSQQIPNWSSATLRLLAPWRFIPSLGSIEIVKVTPGSTSVASGEGLDVVAEVKNNHRNPLPAEMIIAPDGHPETRRTMAADANRQRFTAAIPAVQQAFRYRLEIGDSQTPWFRVELRERPRVESARVTYHYPAYTRQPEKTAALNTLDLEAPQYSVAELEVRLSGPVSQAAIESGLERYPARLEQDGRLLVASLPMLKDGSYSLLLFDEQSRAEPNPRANRITIAPDRPPQVELLKPNRPLAVAPTQEVPIVLRAIDDYGIGRLQLEMRIETSESAENDRAARDDNRPATDGRTIVLEKWLNLDNAPTNVLCKHQLRLASRSLKPGQTVLLRAVAWDNRAVNDWGVNLGPQETATDWLAIRIVSEEVSAADRLKQWQDLRAAIAALLMKQLAARASAATAMQKESLADRADALVPVATQQGDIQNATGDLLKQITTSDDQQQRRIKQALSALFLGEMDQAIQQCRRAINATSEHDSKQSGDALCATQDQIIASLQQLLNAARRAEAAALAQMKTRPGGDLPDDLKQKLEALRDKLDKFLAQQKKVIEASENLAKTPVEDFSKQQQELLKQLAVAEDDLSQFMNELQSDLSKLPEQDFANPSTAKELIEIQVELKMAKDALQQKSLDIAVPLEQLAYERAEELKTNLEKWLPDTPDRERWSQEESLTDQDKEAPMAELPAELEDMVGELLEEEEALFDEMEDASSSAADSLDKGGGWDAMDGPISNMSAKGVTGNRLPNSSEIGGRAGEGRQGKASGEMVDDEAVGKGGRKTPSRLTPDPNVEGRIRDRSQQPAGGATGGGKESGQGGEGLEGPVPRKSGPRDAQRLAGRQAALRNKAEAIDLRMQVANYHRTDLQRMIEAMAQVERDIKAGRYQNALRQRRLLVDGLRNVKQYLQGEFEVRKDATPNVPSDVQKKILGAMQDPSPPGWEAANRDYFGRLSGEQPSSAGKTPTPPPSPRQ